MKGSPYEYYPDKAQRDKWISDILEDAKANAGRAEVLADNGYRNNFGAFRMSETGSSNSHPAGGARPFYGIWRPCASMALRPLVVHLPGYGAELSVHPTSTPRAIMCSASRRSDTGRPRALTTACAASVANGQSCQIR